MLCFVALDLSNVFHTVCHTVNGTDKHFSTFNLRQLLAIYLNNRQTCVEFREVNLKFRRMKQGGSQSGVQLPIFSNY